MKSIPLVLAALAACSSPARPPVKARPVTRLDALSNRVLEHLFHDNPARAVELGLHDYDGELPDISPAGIDEQITTLRADRAALEAATPSTPLEEEERDTLLVTVRGRLFELVDLDTRHQNPMSYSDDLGLDAYVVRDYAPTAVRAAAVIRVCKALPAFLRQARANIKTPVPRPWIDTALQQTRGFIDFVDHEIRTAFTVDIPLVNQADIGPALDTCKAALVEHVTWLEAQAPGGTAEFALGADRFVKMLAETQGIDTDLATLERLAQADLARNTKAIEDAAHAIDPHRPVAEVVAGAAADRPTVDQVLGEATHQAADMRQFLIDHHIVSVPGTEVAEVRPSPPFQRWNAAFLDAPGMFETKVMPAFYYISPPDPTWTPEAQRDYIPPRADLLFTTIHEVYPGHFIHAVHIRRNPSRVLRSVWSYTTGEGWAHYVEEMMWDAGAAGTTPQAHIGQLKEALLRDVRFVVAIGEHAHAMTIDQAETLFRTKAFVDPGNAHQQAVRGTFDPMYLAYTLGKIAIRKLRDDWMAKHPGATPGAFHDAFLSHAAAPLPVIRRAMVGDAAVL